MFWTKLGECVGLVVKKISMIQTTRLEACEDVTHSCTYSSVGLMYKKYMYMCWQLPSNKSFHILYSICWLWERGGSS